MSLPLRAYVALALLFTAIGVWIVIAPTVVGYQNEGASWVSGTYNDVVAGGLLILVSLGLLTAQVVATVRARRRVVVEN